MKRNAKSLQKKAKKHIVQPQSNGNGGGGCWRVTSSSSEKSYKVFERSPNRYHCTCKWSEYHDTRLKPCSHVLAVEEWLAQSGNFTLSFWADEADAKRQHRPTWDVGIDIVATARRI